MFTCLILIHSGDQITSRERGRYGGGKELAEPIFFIKAEPGIAVLGSCCISSAWSRHNDTVGGKRVWFLLEQPRAGGKPGEGHTGPVGMAGTLEPVLLLRSGLVQHAGQMSPWLTRD